MTQQSLSEQVKVKQVFKQILMIQIFILCVTILSPPPKKKDAKLLLFVFLVASNQGSHSLKQRTVTQQDSASP